MDIDIQNSKIELIQWLASLEDKVMIEKLLELRNKDLTHELDALSKAEQNSIRKGIAEANSGNTISHAEARKVYEKWL
ncbi:MAG: hypothetical protein ACPGLV_12365 [Bacteroidia bacterium]